LNGSNPISPPIARNVRRSIIAQFRLRGMRA
jgi:hypothetical protein